MIPVNTNYQHLASINTYKIAVYVLWKIKGLFREAILEKCLSKEFDRLLYQ